MITPKMGERLIDVVFILGLGGAVYLFFKSQKRNPRDCKGEIRNGIYPFNDCSYLPLRRWHTSHFLCGISCVMWNTNNAAPFPERTTQTGARLINLAPFYFLK